MDALVKATIESLCKKTLPETLEQLLLCLHSGLPLDDEDLVYNLKEGRELLTLLLQASNSETTAACFQDSASTLDSKHERAKKFHIDSATSGNSRASEELTTDLSKNENAPLSDDEAYALLAEMDNMEGSAPAPQAPQSQSQASLDMDEDEAMRLLAEMDEPVAVATPPSVTPKQALKQVSHHEEEHAEALFELDDEALVEIPEWEANEFQRDPSMLNDFIVNTDELMQTLDETILQLEQDPSNKKIIEEVFRSAHTLKGAAGMFGFKGIERVMHRMENLFDLIRKEKLLTDSRTIDVVFQGLDILRTLLTAIKDGKPCGVATVPIVEALGLAARGKYAATSKKSAAAPAAVTPEPARENSAPKAPSEDDGKVQKKKEPKEQSTIRVDLERLDVLVNLVGELVIDRSRFASIENELRTDYPQIKVGSNFSETVQLFGRHMNEIQDIIMKVRMVPIGNAFNKFTRVVRDISRSLDKKIELTILGEDAELDKTMVEQIGDPLIHLIRNCCDHGIEMPDVRVEKGKNPQGVIKLSAAQEGNHIAIKIIDDGKGIDPAVIRRKAVEKGLISDEAVLTERDILNLIFEPGFSTAEKVTNLSGRGVGMDVVRRQIMKLKGTIDLESRLGFGMTVTIRLPLTLAIVQSLLVKSRGETFAIPLNSVIESIRISPKDIQKVGDSAVYKLRDNVLPLVLLEEVMSLAIRDDQTVARAGKSKNRSDRLFVVVVGHPEHPTGIIVDQLLNQQEMVIKPMGPLMRNIPCVSGGAVLGQGEVVLVLDVPEIENIGRSRSRQSAA